jgi:putative AbiEii toxin of type IV toxin-antitoxin system
MDSLIVENVRCFRERQEVPLRPLTFLVGENSTGKSTFLALIRCAWQLSRGSITPDFNSEPFLLGAYEQIAHRHGRQDKYASSFTIGGTMPAPPAKSSPRGTFTVVGVFRERFAQPELADWRISIPNASLSIGLGRTRPIASVKTVAREESTRLERPIQGHVSTNVLVDVFEWAFRLSRHNVDDADLRRLLFLIAGLIATTTEELPVACAPIRSRPKRTYDPVRDIAGPEGEHTPMALANLHDSDPKRWRELVAALRAFGLPSGLLEGIEIKRKGKKQSDPFQVNVTIGQSRVNLMDVGYGVSQILPILVDSLSSKPGAQFLLQQPEVHLHPKAQAQLGTLLGLMVRRQRKRFVVETHSDYLIDRARMEVRDGRISHEDVLILYFQRSASKVRIHPIRMDRAGDLLGVPSDYRRFFLHEQRRFISG